MRTKVASRKSERVTRILVATCAAVVLMPLAPAAGAQDPGAPPLFVRASVTTAGPYGESWHLTLAPDGAVSLQVSYRTNPSGNLTARFQLSGERVEAVRSASEAQHFLDLPAELEPEVVQFHRPHLKLEFHLDGRHHEVSLYDPPALKSHAAARRFLEVWETVFAGLPIKPSW